MTSKNNQTEARTDIQLDAHREALARVIKTWAKSTGDYPTPIPSLGFFRRDSPSPPTVCMIEPSIVLVVRGAKEMVIGAEAYSYDESTFFLTSLDLPANSAVITASQENPCLGLIFKLDLRVLAEVLAQGGLPTLKERRSGKSIGIGSVTPGILGPFERLVDLLDEPDAIPVLAPLIQREIHYRLLMSDQAGLLRQILSVDSQGHRVAKAIDWLKLNYSKPFHVEELATRVRMSTPTFNLHFRQLTSMSPLQYQKWLRLNEAKRLMLNEHLDAASAAFKVGYESPSQFSREYGRFFGSPPKRDITTMRNQSAN